MKVHRAWLQNYFDAPLPSATELADTLTFHAFEIESIEGEMLDVKVLPDRACYALSHRGIAAEISAILDIPLAKDPLKDALPEFTAADAPAIRVEDSLRVPRFMAAKVQGVKVGSSPAWLKEALESVGQRSINNVVDATNYVMLNIGQPLHAFDAGKMSASLTVRSAKAEEKMTILGGTEVSLPPGAMVVADGESGVPLGIAGVKGGAAAELTEATTHLIVEAANFEPSAVRKCAQALKLFTDASARFQNRVPAELAAYGMRDVLALITDVAGGEVVGVADAYAGAGESQRVTASRTMLSARLGLELSATDVEGALRRLGLSFENNADSYTVIVPFYRKDIAIPEDLVEEVGRILGYDKVVPTLLPALVGEADQRRFRGIERIKDVLLERGFTEISTQSFAAEGDIELANPLQSENPWLRANLSDNMRAALTRAVLAAPRVLGPAPSVRLFEIGNVFSSGGEHTSLAIGYAPVSGKKQPVLKDVADALKDLLMVEIPDGDDVIELSLADVALETLGAAYAPVPFSLQKFRPFSMYPFALRDVAVWTPLGTEESEAENVIFKEAGEHLARIDTFDRFEKEGRVSFAFRLVFESFEKTLADTDIDPVMARITDALNANEGWQVR